MIALEMTKLLLWLWQLPQNILGFALSLFSQKIIVHDTANPGKKIKVYYADILGYGVSLGNYILLDTCYLRAEHHEVVLHEHGHQKQSKILGPLYLIVIGLPSLTGALIDTFFHKNWPPEQRAKWYHSLPWEAQANKFGGALNCK